MSFRLKTKSQYKHFLASAALAVGMTILPLQLVMTDDGWLNIAHSHTFAASGPGKNGTGSHNDREDDNNSEHEGHENSNVVKVELSTNGVEVCYVEGFCEEIRNGYYTRTSSTGVILESRPATGVDVARFRIRIQDEHSHDFSQSTIGANGGFTDIKISGNNIRIDYANGWREEIKNGQYELRDQFNRRVVRRPATNLDLERMKELVGA